MDICVLMKHEFRYPLFDTLFRQIGIELIIIYYYDSTKSFIHELLIHNYSTWVEN